MLPSRYISATIIYGTNFYFDTGVVPTNTMKINGLFYSFQQVARYLFGARNTNSNTSAGQINLLAGPTGYLGYASARINLGSQFGNGNIYLKKESNEFFINDSSRFLNDVVGASTVFTGTRSMYILALNNGGTPNYGSNNPSIVGVYYFSISENDNKIKEYYPVYDTQTNQFGLYDFINDEFITKSGAGDIEPLRLLTIKATDGGEAFIEMPFGKVTQRYQNSLLDKPYAPIKATPKDGFVFLNWTDENGNVVSAESEMADYTISGDTILTANFIKKTTEKQKNHSLLLGLQYGIGMIQSDYAPNGRDSDHYALIKNYDIKEDILSKTTSTIECYEVPSSYQENMPVFIIDNKGKVVWCGLIKSIEDNKLTCREALAIFDSDFVFTPTNSVGGYNLTALDIRYALWYYTKSYASLSTSYKNVNAPGYNNTAGQRLLNAFGGQLYPDEIFSYDADKNIFYGLPLTEETNVGNLEDFLLDLTNQFGIVFASSLYNFFNSLLPNKGIKHLARLQIANPLCYGELTLGDNINQISNVQVVIENQEATVLEIYNSNGTTLRAIYGMKTDGTIAEYKIQVGVPSESFIGYNNCKIKVVLSDDKIETLKNQHLSSSMFNHKITFDLDLDGNKMFTFDDFKLGRRVNFYQGDKVYKSVVTGKEYSLEENEDEIKTLKITLGNVRTSLTSKLNMGKIK